MTHPAVHLAVVVGVPDLRLDEVVAAFVECRAGASVETNELIAHCRGQIASFKVPRHIRFVTSWPMSATNLEGASAEDGLIPGTGGCPPSGVEPRSDGEFPHVGAAVVTGGSGAIGAAVCRRLAARGANVALTYHSRRDAADAVVESGRGGVGELAAWAVDLADSEAAKRFADEVRERFGSVHTLIHQPGRMCHRYTSVGLHGAAPPRARRGGGRVLQHRASAAAVVA